MLDIQGALHTVSGVAGSFIPGASEIPGVLALACAERTCVAKTDSALITRHGTVFGTVTAPPGAAVLTTDGKSIAGYFPATGEFLAWQLSGRIPAMERLVWNPGPGDVLSIRLTPSGSEVALRRGGQVWIVSQDGAALGSLPAEATGPVLLIDTGVVYATDSKIVLQESDGTTSGYSAPLAGALLRMSPGWVEIVSAEGLYALRITPGREALYRLPDGAQ